MKIIITDTGIYPGKLNKDDILIRNDGTVHSCKDCFACWLKTPGICVQNDPLKHFGRDLSKCDELVIVSRCVLSGVSPFVKNVLERSRSYVIPEFVSKDGRTMYRRRYRHSFDINVYFYGDDVKDAEKETAAKWIRMFAEERYARVQTIRFMTYASEIGGIR